MGYLQDGARGIRDAFAETKLDPAVDAILEATWLATGTGEELSEMLGELGAHLRQGGHGREADLCLALREAVDAFAEPRMTPEWFVAKVLRITGWGKPSPTLAAQGYFERRRTKGAVLRALGEVCQDLADQRVARIRKEIRRQERCDQVWGVARTALAIGTLGISRAFEDV